MYAGHTSKYISLPEIEELIRSGKTVEIVDSRTGEDLTGAVLVQIIAENHPEKIAMFPTAMLHSILRANNVMMGFLQDYFRNSLAYLDYFQKHGTSEPLQQPMHWMKVWLDKWSMQSAKSRSGSVERPPAERNGEALDERIAELERRIAELEEERRQKA